MTDLLCEFQWSQCVNNVCAGLDLAIIVMDNNIFAVSVISQSELPTPSMRLTEIIKIGVGLQ